LAASRALLLSLATGLAAQSAIRRSAGITIDIRWPNDLMIAEKKCGGILVETSVEPSGQLRHAVIGIGINVRHMHLPEELATIATSLHLANGGDYDRQKLLVALLKSLDDEVRLLESAHSAEALLERFEAASTWVRGKRVRVEEAGGYTGITAGLSPQGFLLVQTDEGPRTVLSGGVRAL
jgi:BirA family biotin operon repressor/biotin-[acetyl-CoA-carboxylase] ligase